MGDWLTIERENVGLNFGSNLSIDVHDFLQLLAACKTHGHPANEHCAACTQPLMEAVRLYSDDFLAGFGLRDSPNFDDWQFYQADTFRREFAAALEGLVQYLSASRKF